VRWPHRTDNAQQLGAACLSTVKRRPPTHTLGEWPAHSASTCPGHPPRLDAAADAPCHSFAQFRHTERWWWDGVSLCVYARTVNSVNCGRIPMRKKTWLISGSDHDTIRHRPIIRITVLVFFLALGGGMRSLPSSALLVSMSAWFRVGQWFTVPTSCPRFRSDELW